MHKIFSMLKGIETRLFFFYSEVAEEDIGIGENNYYYGDGLGCSNGSLNGNGGGYHNKDGRSFPFESTMSGDDCNERPYFSTFGKHD